MKSKIVVFVLVLAAAGVVISLGLQQGPAPPSPPLATPQPKTLRPRDSAAEAAEVALLAEADRKREAARKAREAAWKKIQPHLAAADKAAAKAIKKQCDRVSEFFAERRKRARPFAEATLSIGSKWAFVKSKLPFTDSDGHRNYLRERFEQTVFSGAELEEVLKSAVKGCVAELQGIENDLLVTIRADLGDDDLAALKGELSFPTDAALRREYARAVEQAAKSVQRDLPVWGGREVVTWVGADLTNPIFRSLAASLVARLGLSGTILGGSAATGAFTLGGAVVAGILLDALLDRLLRAIGYDPEGGIEEQVVEALQYCEDLILAGDALADIGRFLRTEEPWIGLGGGPKAPADTPSVPPGQEKKYQKFGLIDQLFLLASGRAKLRREALKKLVLEGGVK